MSDQITYSLDGLDSENGHIKLDALLDRLEHFLATLNRIDRIVGEGTPKLYYRVVQTSHNSAIRFVLEPVPKPRARVARGYVQKCRLRLFKEMNAVHRMEPTSHDIDMDLLDDIRDISIGIGEEFKRAEISNGEDRVEIDDEFEKHIKLLTGEEDVSYGGLEGKLDAANIHDETRRFWIYPKVGPQKVRCDFRPGTQAQIRDAMGQYVRVEGLKYFRATSPHPFRIKVTDFNVINIKGAISLNDLRGMAPDATEALSAVEFVRKIRDEWD